MADVNNPLHYSDLIVKDDSIEKLIEELERLNKTYSAMIKPMIQEAKQLREELARLSPTNKENQTQIEQGAKKADQLAAAQERLFKSMTQNGERITQLNILLKEQNQINAINAKSALAMAGSFDEMSAKIAKLKLEYNAMSEAQRNSTQGKSVANNIAELTAKTKALNAEQKERIRLAELEQKIAKNAVGSYNRLSAEYAKLKIQYDKMGDATDKDIRKRKELAKQLDEIYAKMNQLQVATGKHQLQVGNYAKSWDGLRFSIFQMVREMPNAAIGINTLFLALSNNIPIFVDELQRAKAANDALIASGQKGVPIWKQIGSALFSWQTALIAVITALVLYADKIEDFIKVNFSFNKSVNASKEAVKSFNEELVKENTQYGKNVATFKRLKDQWDTLKNDKSRLEFVKKNAESWRELDWNIKNVADAEKVFNHYTDNAVTALQLRAKAAAAAAVAMEKYQESFRKETESNTRKKSAPTFADYVLGEFTEGNVFANIAFAPGARFLNGVAGWLSKEFYGKDLNPKAHSHRNSAAQNLADESKTLEAEAKHLDDIYNSLIKQAEALEKEAGITGWTDDKKGGKHGRTPIDLTNTINDLVRTLTEDLNESYTALKKEGFEKKAEEIENKTIASIDKLEKVRDRIAMYLANKNGRYAPLTDAQKDTLLNLNYVIDETIFNYRQAQRLQKELLDMEKNATAVRFNANMQRGKEGYLYGMSNSSATAFSKRTRSAEYNADVAALKLSYATKEQTKENQIRFNQEMALLWKKYNADILRIEIEGAMAQFDHQQKMEQLSFDSMEHTEKEKTLFMIEQQKARIQELLKTDKTLTPEQRAELQGQLGVLNFQQEMANRPKDIYDIMGLKLTDSQKQGIDDMVSYASDALNSLMQLEEAYAQKAVENANKRVDAAKNALQVEKEARANGYANNVEMAQKEYEQSKKMQEKAIAQQKRIQKTQIAIDAATQVSNLVTASSGIWKSFPNPAIAIPMIALMWASFAASKIMAAKAVDASADEEYGEGTIELLQGGSHQSGNDIDLGTKADGTRRRAEGGEFFAVINKRNSRKYRKEIPSLINSLNNGTFERKYMLAEKGNAELGKYISAYDKAGNITLKVERDKADLSKLQNGVDRLVAQGERRFMYAPNGDRIEYYKNVKRIITA